jgi:hypothetical protein
MGPIVATYLVKVTLRAKSDLLDAPPPGGDVYPPDPPPNDAVVAVVEAAFAAGRPDLVANVTSERTDI